ncbi:hypothetical protein HZC21_01415 [Candidatus Peregrinibacteria bacterium]|nr:hypothetical protein [Candidatus Peregrinibacteria bacterium]
MTWARLIKKIFSLTLSAFAVLIVSGFLSLQPISEPSAYAQNTGGSISYGATLDTSTGALGGYAWGDNIGWINMNGATYDVKVATANGTNGGTCGASLNKGDVYGYAWTDTVGWMDFCGTHVDLDALSEPKPETPPTNGTTTTPDSGASEETEPGQAADIKGNVNINIITSFPASAGKIGQSLGEQAQSRREGFYRAVKNTVTAVPNMTAAKQAKKHR